MQQIKGQVQATTASRAGGFTKPSTEQSSKSLQTSVWNNGTPKHNALPHSAGFYAKAHFRECYDRLELDSQGRGRFEVQDVIVSSHC
jgi:hypothetical protein